jgi:ribosomal protein S18 acetylase RimI-like enzyme
MAADWRIRAAGQQDAASLGLIGAATFLETFAGILDGGAIVAHCLREHAPGTYEAYLGTGAAAWLAETTAGAAPVGYAMVASAKLPGAEQGDLELKRIYALSRFHGSGLGRGLMEAAIDHARTLGAPRLLLGVYAGNARALAFYARNGFVRIAERMFQVGEKHYEDHVLAKPLG